MRRFLRAAPAFLWASARKRRTCFGSIFWGRVPVAIDEFDALSVPDVGDERVAGIQALLKFSRGKNSVVDFAVEGTFGLAKL